jgi:hypothetical protein
MFLTKYLRHPRTRLLRTSFLTTFTSTRLQIVIHLINNLFTVPQFVFDQAIASPFAMQAFNSFQFSTTSLFSASVACRNASEDRRSWISAISA